MGNSSIDRSIRLIYDLHGINFSNNEIMVNISECLIAMDTYSRNLTMHCLRVSNYAAALGKWLKLSDRERKLLWCAAIFHDIGKSTIPLEILNKPKKLTNEENRIIKEHSRKGCEIVNKRMRMKGVSKIILYHHEWFDGKGYPSGILGYNIPLMSRIISVVDAFDAMTTERPYRMVLSMGSALAELENGKWTQFDGDIVDCFIDLIDGNYLKPKEINIALGIY